MSVNDCKVDRVGMKAAEPWTEEQACSRRPSRVQVRNLGLKSCVFIFVDVCLP